MRDRIRTVEGRARPPVVCKLPVSLLKTSASDCRRDLRRSLPCDSSGAQSTSSKPLILEELGRNALNDETNQDAMSDDVGDKSSDEKRSTFVSDPEQALATRDCNFCHLTDDGPWHTWTTVQKLTSGALTGQQCCSLVLDAISSWVGDKILSSKLYPDSLGEIEIRLKQKYWHSKRDQSRQIARPIIEVVQPLSAGEESSKRPWNTLYMFEPKDSFICKYDPASRYEFPLRPLPSGNTASQQAFTCLRNWIYECTHHHELCRQALSQEYSPKRVLEITCDYVFLRESAKPGIKYACLSHCWGPKGLAFKLTHSTMEDLKSGIVISTLPKTFRDALEVCLRLAIRFIWIDALCILQDDDADWRESAATMADIYENAFLTIAATASKDSNSGCFSDPNSPFQAKKLRGSILHVAKSRLQDHFIEVRQIRGNFGGWPLLDRAWVFQERRMSARVVHFTDIQLLWECHSMFKSESGDIDEEWTKNGYNNNERSDGIPFKCGIKDVNRAWQTTVEDYSQLRLTFSKDRLPALAAVVQRMMSARRKDTYVAGMWKSSILQDLMWVCYDPYNEPRLSTTAPTWSWASVAGGVRFYNTRVSFVSKLVALAFTPVGPPQLGDVVYASITLLGYSFVGSLCRKPTGDLGLKLEEQVLYDYKQIFCLTLQEDYDLTTGVRPVKQGDRLYVVFMGFESLFSTSCTWWTGLALRKVSRDEYERIGSCSLLSFSATRETPIRRMAKTRDNLEWRLYRHLITSLPIRQFKII